MTVEELVEILASAIRAGETIPFVYPEKLLALAKGTKQYPHDWPTTFGSFTECVDKVASWASNPEAFCAWLHHEAEGKWPAEKGASRRRGGNMSQRAMGLLGVDPGQKAIDFKKKIQTSSAPSLLQPVEVDRLIDYVIDESKLWQIARVERMERNQQWVRFLNIQKGLLRRDQCGSYTDTGNISADGILLDAKKYKAVIPICDDMLRDNITGPALEDQVLRMVADQLANELEIMALMANTGGGYNHPDVDASVFHLFDGWYWQMKSGNLRNTTYPHCCIDLCHFGMLMKALPTKYRKDKTKLNYFMATDVFEDWGELLQKRGTNLGDAVITGAQPPKYMVTPITDLPLLPTDLPNICGQYEDGDTGTFMFLSDPNNLVLGIQYDVEYERERDAKNSQTFHIFRISFDAKVINVAATALLENLTTRSQCCAQTSGY
jgi:hypothetical protein